MGAQAEPLAAGGAVAQGRDVPGQGRRDGRPRTGRRGRGLQLRPPGQEPEEDRRLLRSRRQGRGHRQAQRRLHLQGLQRRVRLPFRLGLLLGHHAQGGGGRRRARLEKRQRHRPLPDGQLRPGQLARLQEEPRLLGHRDHRRREAQAALRRRHHLPLHQGRGHHDHRLAHRQGRCARSHPLERRRVAEEAGAQAAVEQVPGDGRHVRGHAHRHQAVRRHPRAAGAEHGGQQARDHQDLLGRQCRAAGLSDAPDLGRLLRAAGRDARRGEGVVRLQPDQGQGVAGRGRLPQRLYLQDPDHFGQHRQRLAGHGGGLPGQGGREDGDPGAGVPGLHVGDGHQDQLAGLLHVHRRDQPDDLAAQELLEGPVLESVAVQRPRVRQEDGRGLCRAG